MKTTLKDSKTREQKPKASALRFPFFDSYRGFALILMAIYHFSFDLNQFGILHEDMNYSEFWLNFRAIIMTSFLSLVGISLQFAKSRYSDPHFFKRLFKVGGCAALISVATYFMNPETWIYFGVLHLIFLASLIGPLLVRFPRIVFVLGWILVAIPNFYRSLWFYQPVLHLTGLSPLKPNTEDFAPLMPWLGVIFIGVGIGHWVMQMKLKFAIEMTQPFLAKLGRNSLLFYMTHQLVLYPLAWALSFVFH